MNFIPPLISSLVGTADGVIDQRSRALLPAYRLGLLASGLTLTYLEKSRPDIAVSLQVCGAYGLASSAIAGLAGKAV